MKCVIRGRYRKRTSLFNLYFSFRKLSVLAISSNKMTWKPFCSYLNEIGSNQVDWHGACSMFIISYLYLVIYWGPQALLVTVYTVECLYTNFQKKLSEPRAIFTVDKRYENDHWFRPRSRISRMTDISYDHFNIRRLVLRYPAFLVVDKTYPSESYLGLFVFIYLLIFLSILELITFPS